MNIKKKRIYSFFIPWKYPLLLLFVVLVFYYKVFLNFNEMLNSSDIIGTYALEKNFFTLSILELHRFPLWNPFIFSGTPFPGIPTTAVFYPINYLFLLFKDSAFGYIYVLNVYLISIFTYLFARKIHLDKISSFFSAIVFAFSASIATRIIPGHIFMLDNIVWFPLLLYFWESTIQTKKSIYAILASIPIGYMFLSGFIQIAFYSLFISSCYIAIRLFFEIVEKKNTSNLWRIVFLFCFSLLLGFGIGAAQILPTLEFSKFSLRIGGLSYDIATSFSLHPFQITAFIFPYLFGTPFTFWGKGNFHENSAYLGILPLIFMFLAFTRFKNKYIFIFSFFALFVLSYALGQYSPLFFLFYKFIPGFNLFRVPARILYIYSFSVSILAGFGFSIFFEKSDFFWKHRFLKVFQTVLFFIGFISLYLLTYLNFSKNSLQLYEKFVLRNKYANDLNHISLFHLFLRDLSVFGISILLFTVFIFLKKRKIGNTKTLQIFIIFLVLADVWFFSYKFIRLIKPQDVFKTPQVIQKIKKDKGRYRVFDLSERVYQIVIRNNLESTIGVNSQQLKDYRNFFWLVGDHENWPYESFFQFKHTITNSKILNLLNVKYVIADERLNNPELKEIYRSKDQLKIVALPSLLKHPGFYLYLNQFVLPRAYIVPNAYVSQNTEKAIALVTNNLFNPTQFVVLDKKPVNIPLLSNEPFKEITITRYEPDKIQFVANVKKSGFVVISEIWYPGWKAYDNGKEIPIYKADGILRAFALEHGFHNITLVYRPLSVILGFGISSITSVFLIIFFIFYLKYFRYTEKKALNNLYLR